MAFDDEGKRHKLRGFTVRKWLGDAARIKGIRLPKHSGITRFALL
jgi:hypothetical protein